MTIRKIDADLPADDLKAVLTALETVRQKLPFLIGLTSSERRKLFKIGRKAQTFVGQALDVATQHTELMPRCLDVEAARRDIALFESLNPVLQTLNQLRELVEDTQMLVGSEAYATARLAYNSARTAGKNMGLDEVFAELGQQFRKQRKGQSEV